MQRKDDRNIEAEKAEIRAVTRCWRFKSGEPGYIEGNGEISDRVNRVLNLAVDAFGGTAVPVNHLSTGSPGRRAVMLAHEDGDFTMLYIGCDEREMFMVLARDYSHAASYKLIQEQMVNFATLVGQLVDVAECYVDDTWCSIVRAVETEEAPEPSETAHPIDSAFGPGSP